MKKLFIAALATLSVNIAHADDYAVVDLERVVQSSIYLKQQNTSLQNTIKPQTMQIEQLQKDLNTIQEKGQAAKTAAEREKLAKDFETKAEQLAKLQQQVQNIVQNSMQNVNKTFDARLKATAEQLRLENKLDVVLNKNAVLAYEVKADLTDKMIQKVNAIK
ncbi:OmpH family outer membrane protein [uncultured Acinetobacter sp.]|uniref:OmpH family outer membrane protein n=1 Tax=uncultured Acinetobacter sp. TaxID=165433 RepID=UPI00262E3C5E|nr:OmpH family outer membrane protein [uncultured Acinetobacter sp.]